MGTVSSEQQVGGIAVPTTLAIKGYHETTNGDIATMISSADDLNAPRITTGQQQGGADNALDPNLGANSLKNVSEIIFTISTAFSNYGIEDEDDLKALATEVNNGNTFAGKTFVLMDDIELTGQWTPIGTAVSETITYEGQGGISSVSDASKPFEGTFNGNGKTISGLSINSTSSGQGLFGYLGANGTLKDLTVEGAITNSSSGDYVGGVVAYNRGVIDGIKSNVVISAGSAYNVGGIVGFNDGRTGAVGEIKNSANLGAVTGAVKVGGIAGQNAGTISQCYNTAKIDGTNLNSKNGVGGIAGRNGNNNTTSNTYHFGAYDFNGKTIKLGSNINMGSANYMPVGGQYLMDTSDTTTLIGSSFCGVFDGQGHTVTIKCDRIASAYGDGQSIGLIGRLGAHDSDPANLYPSGATVKNVAVKGSVKGNRSVGGIVGKIGKTNGGATIENCANFASVSNTDSKGVGGIAGSGWNGGIIRNCYNAGTVSSIYDCPTGGISGSNEITIKNCYNIGTITALSGSDYAMAIGTNNFGAPFNTHIINCWYLDTSASGGYYDGSAKNDGSMTAEDMKNGTPLSRLDAGTFAEDKTGINGGYPVLAWQVAAGDGGYTDPSDSEPQDGPGNGENIITEIEANTNVENGKSVSSVDSDAVTNAVMDAAKAIEDTKKAGETNTIAEVKISAKSNGSEDVSSSEVSIPAAALKDAAVRDDILLTIESDVSIITFDSATLSGALKGANDDDAMRISAEILDNTMLDEAQKEIVGDNPVIDLALYVGSAQIHDFEGAATITIPYTPPEAIGSDDYELITVYYMNNDGDIKEMTGAKYDPDTGTITFTTNHFSVFFLAEWINPFTDVQKDDWFYRAMRFVYSANIMNGTTAATFSPDTLLTRAMLVTMLYRNEGEPAVTGANPFSDVADGQWYTNAVLWAFESGIVEGYGDRLFGTNNSITREQIATILKRYSEWKGFDAGNRTELSAYSDAGEISSWAEDAMKWTNAEGLITGRTETTLSPKGTGTRAEVAAILQRFVENYEQI